MYLCANDRVGGGSGGSKWPSYWLRRLPQEVPGFLQFVCESFIELSDLGPNSAKSQIGNGRQMLFFLQIGTHIHIQITPPSIISWAIHCSGLHTEWMHSSHNYCGGSHTLYRSIPVSKSRAENSERARFPKDIMRFSYLRLSQKRGAQFTKHQNGILTDSHVYAKAGHSWKRRIQRRRMLARSERQPNF